MEIPSLINAKRISIIGPPGSGKSTLAIKLGGALGLPVHHGDCYFLQPNWTAGDKKKTYEQLIEIANGDKWIIEGNYVGTLEARCEKGDIVIFLDFDTEFCRQMVIYRNKSTKRIGVPEFLNNTPDNLDGMMGHIDRWPSRKTEEVLPILEKYKQKVVTLTNREELETWLTE